VFYELHTYKSDQQLLVDHHNPMAQTVQEEFVHNAFESYSFVQKVLSFYYPLMFPKCIKILKAK